MRALGTCSESRRSLKAFGVRAFPCDLYLTSRGDEEEKMKPLDA